MAIPAPSDAAYSDQIEKNVILWSTALWSSDTFEVGYGVWQSAYLKSGHGFGSLCWESLISPALLLLQIPLSLYPFLGIF